MKIILSRLPSGMARATITDPDALKGIMGEMKSMSALQRDIAHRFPNALVCRLTRAGQEYPAFGGEIVLCTKCFAAYFKGNPCPFHVEHL